MITPGPRLIDHDSVDLDMYTTEDVYIERARQIDKWGEQHATAYGWLTVIMEELGEVAQAALKGNSEEYAQELVEVAACCYAALADYQRRGFDDSARRGEG